MMRRESVQMPLPLGGSCGITERSVRKRTVKITIRWEPELRRQLFQAGCDIDGGRIVAGMKCACSLGFWYQPSAADAK